MWEVEARNPQILPLTPADGEGALSRAAAPPQGMVPSERSAPVGRGGEDTTAGHAEFHPQLGVVPAWRWPRRALCPAPLPRVIPAPRAGSAPASRGVLGVSHRLRRVRGCPVVPEALRGKGRGGQAGGQSPARPPRVQGFCLGAFCPSPGGARQKPSSHTLRAHLHGARRGLSRSRGRQRRELPAARSSSSPREVKHEHPDRRASRLCPAELGSWGFAWQCCGPAPAGEGRSGAGGRAL